MIKIELTVLLPIVLHLLNAHLLTVLVSKIKKIKIFKLKIKFKD